MDEVAVGVIIRQALAELLEGVVRKNSIGATQPPSPACIRDAARRAPASIRLGTRREPWSAAASNGPGFRAMRDASR